MALLLAWFSLAWADPVVPAPWLGGDPVPWQAVEGLDLQDQVIGTGATVVEGGKVTVHYVGMLSDGTVFDASIERGEPFTFAVGAHQVIPGWERGLVGMKVGGTRRLVIPPELGYRDRDMGAIPPNSTLYFEVQVLGFEPPRAAPEAPEEVAPERFKVLPTGDRWADLVVGAGEKTRADGRVCIDYAMWDKGARADHTYARPTCTWYRLGDDDLPPALDESLLRMRVGGVRQIVVADGTKVYRVELEGAGR